MGQKLNELLFNTNAIYVEGESIISRIDGLALLEKQDGQPKHALVHACFYCIHAKCTVFFLTEQYKRPSDKDIVCDKCAGRIASRRAANAHEQPRGDAPALST